MAESFVLGILLKLRDSASKGVKSALGGIERLGTEAEETHKRLYKLEAGFGKLQSAGFGLAATGAAAAGARNTRNQPQARPDHAELHQGNRSASIGRLSFAWSSHDDHVMQ